MKDRGILTERDREIIQHEPNHDRRSEIKSRVKTRVDRIQKDLEIIEETEPELAEKLRTELCEAGYQNAILDVVRNIEEEIQEIKDGN
jgi:hypothetical protein